MVVNINRMNNGIRNVALASSVMVACLLIKKVYDRKRQKQCKRRQRRTWQEKWLQRRDEGRGMLNMLKDELLTEDPDMYKNFLRMENTHFEDILSRIHDDIAKQDTHLRMCVASDKRLALTLRYLATGNSYRDLMFATRIHETTISLIVPEVCRAIVKRMLGVYIKMPQTTMEWESIAKEYNDIWNFPMCIGALDGKHITFEAPRRDGSYYYNYKGQHSIVLLALADAHYRFIYVDVGVNGRNSDGRVFQESSLKRALDMNRLNLPQDSYLPGTTLQFPYCIVADDAFPLSKRVMKPYPFRGLTRERRICNYRISRARRVIENAFGILSNRFRILRTAINLCPAKVELITLTCCILHNYLATHNRYYIDAEDEEFPLAGLTQQGGCHSSHSALDTRNRLCAYFNSPAGSVEWQNRAIGIE